VVSEIRRHDVFGRAAELSYFLVFSIVPALLILTAALGYVARGEELRVTLLGAIGQFVPGRGFWLLSDLISHIGERPSAGKLSIGILVTLWAASSGMSSVIEGLNKAYEVCDVRPWWKTRALAIVLTIALALLIVAALAILFYGGQWGLILVRWLGFSEGLQRALAIARWPAVVVFVFLGFLLIYRFGPNLPERKWRGIVPGAVCALALWLLMSLGLRVYLRWFPMFGPMYGSLGAALVLLLWLYLTSATMLIGGELNSEIENSAARRDEGLE
jgi:membrane protein